MIELTGVEKGYRCGLRGRARALSGLDLRVAEGECVAVVGPNGAGKSTLFGILAGLLRADGGRVRVGSGTPRSWARRRGVGLLPDGAPFPPGLTAREALTRLALLDGLSGRRLRFRVEACLDRVDLAERATTRVSGLSRGLRQRLGIAALLLVPRRLVLLDEPLTGLDPVWRAGFRAVLEELRLRDPARTVLVASHEVAAVSRAADRVVVLAEGRTVDAFHPAAPIEAERRVLAALSGVRAVPSGGGSPETGAA